MIHLARKNIQNLKPYSSARHEFKGTAKVYLDANENPFNNGMNRYPDPMRIFCEPGIDNIITLPPTYGMYQVSADINNVEVRKVNLTTDYQLDVDAILAAVDDHTKI